MPRLLSTSCFCPNFIVAIAVALVVIAQPAIVRAGIDSDYMVTTLAGSPTIPGSDDGVGNSAKFSRPRGMTVSDGNVLFLADADNHTIRRVTSTGVVTTLAGSPGSPGSLDGVGSAARFNQPRGVAVADDGMLYVADMFNHLIRQITPDGVVTTLAGTAGSPGAVDGLGTAARFNLPHDITVTSDGTLFVADAGNHTIRQITPAGLVSTLAGTPGVPGATDGTGTAARFNNPNGISVADDGMLFVSDAVNHLIRSVTSAGVVTTVAGMAGVPGSSDGMGTAARFNVPHAIAATGDGTLYVADAGNHTIRQITPAGLVSTIAGTAGFPGSNDGPGPIARFYVPRGIAIANDQTVYVSDTDNHTVRSMIEICCLGLMRGNVDYDPGDIIDISDLVYLVDWMFSGGPAPSCLAEADIDASGSMDISDLVYLVDFMFSGGPPPVACP